MCAEIRNYLIYPTYQYAVHLAMKNPHAAIPWADSVITQVSNAHAADPEDMKFVDWTATANAILGYVYLRAGERAKGLKMIADGIAQLQQMIDKHPTIAGEYYYKLATAHRNLGDDALEHNNPRKALQEYGIAEQLYSEDAAKIPEDLEVYVKQSENECSLSAVLSKLGLPKEARVRRLQAIEHADRVLKRHTDNQVVQNLKSKATALGA